jgi:hypothetical protein
MSAVQIRPAQLGGKRTFSARSLTVKSAETFIAGAPLTVDSNGQLAECGTDFATTKGFAANAAFSGPGRSLADTVIAVTPPSGEPYSAGQVYVAGDDVVFVGQLYSGSTLITPTEAMIADNYGMTRLSDGIWTLDQVKTTTAYQRVTVVDIDADLSLMFFKVMSTYIQA